MGKKKLEIRDAVLLAEWYEEHKRPLPWRDAGNPYDVWLSEIMLQQTRIEAVKPKFLAFKESLPEIKDLADCEDDFLMHLWEGLGYYSRARNLKKCAAVLVKEYNSQLPDDYALLKKLPGIGPYTAGAIGSIAFNLPVSAVDGNVMRVLARVFAIKDDVRDPKTKEQIEKTIEHVYQTENFPYGNFNQGLMELGETVCLPNGRPLCELCPLSHICSKQWETIPYRSKLKERKIINRTILLITDGESYLLHKRPDTGLLASLYEFPGIEKECDEEEVFNIVSAMGYIPSSITKLEDSKHIFTHLEWHMAAYEITVSEMIKANDKSYTAVKRKDMRNYAIPSAFETYKKYIRRKENY